MLKTTSGLDAHPAQVNLTPRSAAARSVYRAPLTAEATREER
ncbi:MAG: hypothetical protein OES09_05325 [Gammaproteobacteria bacterium]|nr:hypothetical protein [Gammaproteobacteria bacterium]